MDVGALTVLLWTFREREKLLDIYDVLCGARFTTSYTRIGGLQQDWTPQCTAMLNQFLGERCGNTASPGISLVPDPDTAAEPGFDEAFRA